MPPGGACREDLPTMIDPEDTHLSAVEVLHRLGDLRFERALAAPAGLLDDDAYITELDGDIAASEQLYVGLAVTEIATLRAELTAPLVG